MRINLIRKQKTKWQAQQPKEANMSLLLKYQSLLDRLRERSRFRRLESRVGYDFSSNDYLGLSQSKELNQAAIDALKNGVGVGAGGSRLLRGNDVEHEVLEKEAAQFFGAERTLFMGGGFNANMAIFSTLPQKGDLIVYDALIHASAHEGMRLSKADSLSFEHNNAQAADDVISAWKSDGGEGKVWLTFESVYSMDGDVAHMADLIAIADKYDGFVVIDEAHATGVYGKQGRGLAHAFHGKENIITLHTCGKALGASGAIIGAASVLIDVLVNKARGFIYATAPSPLNASIVRASLNLLQAQPNANKTRQEKLADLVTHANAECVRLLLPLGDFNPSGTQILPIIIGDDKKTMQIASNMRERGFDVRGIRPPTVPRGTSRLRITLTLNNDVNTVTAMFEALKEELSA